MTKFDEMIATMRSVSFAEKKQFLEYLVRMAEQAKHLFSQEDKDALLSYACEEVENMLRAIPEAANYKEKDLIFECENFLFGLIMNLCTSSAQLPQDKLLKIKALAELVQKERYIETTLDSIFEQPAIEETDMNRLLYWARQSTDEFQKSKLFLGLAHYQDSFEKMSPGAKKLLTDYMTTELRRLPALHSEDAWGALELLADVSKHFADENVAAALLELMKLGRNHINFYAVGTLYHLGQPVPQEVISALALDLEYANLTYGLLQRYEKTALFPAECATEEYLAKSDLVRWLTYPTELGKAPDAIAYIGKIKQPFKKEVFHVFKFRSDSNTLDDALRNKWLVGWSSNEGGTFSNFDEFAPFEKETAEKALKLIKKKLIG